MVKKVELSFSIVCLVTEREPEQNTIKCFILPRIEIISAAKADFFFFI